MTQCVIKNVFQIACPRVYARPPRIQEEETWSSPSLMRIVESLVCVARIPTRTARHLKRHRVVAARTRTERNTRGRGTTADTENGASGEGDFIKKPPFPFPGDEMQPLAPCTFPPPPPTLVAATRGPPARG